MTRTDQTDADACGAVVFVFYRESGINNIYLVGGITATDESPALLLASRGEVAPWMLAGWQVQIMPTKDAGGWIDGEKLYDFLLDQAKNNPVEVAVYELKRGKEPTKYFVLPWKDNTKSNSVLPMGSLGRYIPGYSYKDIIAVFHTHPSSNPPSTADKTFSDKYNLPIYSIGANGTSYLYIGGTISPIDLKLYFGY